MRRCCAPDRRRFWRRRNCASPGAGRSTAVSAEPAAADRSVEAQRKRPNGAASAKAGDKAPPSPTGPLHIIVSIDKQRATLFADGQPVASTAISTGTPGHPTPMGVFTVIQKRPPSRLQSLQRVDALHAAHHLVGLGAARRAPARLSGVARLRPPDRQTSRSCSGRRPRWARASSSRAPTSRRSRSSTPACSCRSRRWRSAASGRPRPRASSATAASGAVDASDGGRARGNAATCRRRTAVRDSSWRATRRQPRSASRSHRTAASSRHERRTEPPRPNRRPSSQPPAEPRERRRAPSVEPSPPVEASRDPAATPPADHRRRAPEGHARGRRAGGQRPADLGVRQPQGSASSTSARAGSRCSRRRSASSIPSSRSAPTSTPRWA